MGLASSQARLLSITARLTDNEYRTQRLTNARLKLTDISNAARTQYQDALQSQQFQYMTYDASGDSTNIAFTPAVAWQYQPCKNQYAIVNQAGNIMVSSIDAKNFRETDNLAEFLKRYDCLDRIVKTDTLIENKTKEIPNPAYIAWDEKDPPENKIVIDDTLSKMFLSASHDCYCRATGEDETDVDCYLHVLFHLLTLKNDVHYGPDGEFVGFRPSSDYDQGPYITTAGEIPDIFYLNGRYMYDSFINDHGHSDEMKPICIALREGYKLQGDTHKYTILASEMEKYDEISEEIPDTAYKYLNGYYLQQGSTNKEHILMSNYYKDVDGNIKLKSLRQKCIDIFDLVHNYAINFDANFNQKWGKKNQELGRRMTDEETKNLYLECVANFKYKGLSYVQDLIPIIKTIQIDLKQLTLETDMTNPYPKTIFVQDESEVKVNTKEIITVTDPEKAQWYTNLWYRMNGMDEPERIYKNVEDVVNDRQEEQTYTEYLLKLFDIKKNTFTTCYQELPANLASSKDWLNDALAQGWVTLQKAGVSRTTAKDKFKWSDIIYSNASDITLTQDDNAIARAEAKYTQALREVNSKDKVFENKIRKLDTEHNALQTEYNSVKAAIDKNVERSFKVFQG